MAHDAHSLLAHGFRYCASPCRTKAKWLHLAEMHSLYPDWHDITGMSADQMVDFFKAGGEEKK